MRALGLPVVALLLFGLGAEARNTGGAASGAVLNLGTGARGPAMADALTAAADRTEALRYNPAALGWTKSISIEASYNDIVLDVTRGDFAFVHPVAGGSFGIGLSYLDWGKTTRTTVSDPTGAAGATFGGQDIVFSAGYGLAVGKTLSLGVTGRILNSTIDRKEAAAALIDLGLDWRKNDRLRAGITIRNIGSRLRYDRVPEDLPLAFHAGISYDLLPKILLTTAEFEKRRGEDAVIRAGAEYRPAAPLALRAGYANGHRAGHGLTLGAGLRRDALEIDYAWSPLGELGYNHRVGMKYNFGAPPPGEVFIPKSPKDAFSSPPVSVP